MIHLVTKIPHKIYVAVLGGPDSMAALDFVSYYGKRNVTALNFHHGTEFGELSQEFVRSFCRERNIEFCSGKITRDKRKDESPEEYWRNERYEFFSNFSDAPIVLAHTLDDAVETWLFSSFHGRPDLIPIKNKMNIIRPFILSRRSEVLKWNANHGVPSLEDPSNFDNRYARVRIRHEILPLVEKINPGIYKVVKKKYLEMINGKA